MSQIQVNNTINSVGVENTVNTVNVGIDDNIIIVPQEIVKIIEIVTPGPQGPPGPSTDVAFNEFTASYYLNSASFDIRINDLSSSALIFEGVENYIPIFNSSSSITSSNIYVTESNVAINTTTASAALTVNTITSSVDALQVQITGSTYFTVNNEGVVVFSAFANTPTAISGGLFYSASGDYFFGIP
jgi:hypothetical protein